MKKAGGKLFFSKGNLYLKCLRAIAKEVTNLTEKAQNSVNFINFLMWKLG
jgi:hypothetical protein